MPASHLNPHQKPPERLRIFYKRYQRLDLADLGKDPDLVDFAHGLDIRHINMVRFVRTIDATASHKSLSCLGEKKISESLSSPTVVYEHVALPGGLVTAS